MIDCWLLVQSCLKINNLCESGFRFYVISSLPFSNNKTLLKGNLEVRNHKEKTRRILHS